MLITCVSDVHGQVAPAYFKNIPPCDVFVIAGDFLPDKSQNPHWRGCKQTGYLERFNDICFDIPAHHIIMVAGNHDWLWEETRRPFGDTKMNFTYLCDSGIEIDGVKFYGSPWQPAFHNWAFNLPRDGRSLDLCWKAIPDNTNVLITHSPPYGILDVPDGQENSYGCKLLRQRIDQLENLFLHVFGHIHANGISQLYSVERHRKLTCVNAALCNESYEPICKIRRVKI